MLKKKSPTMILQTVKKNFQEILRNIQDLKIKPSQPVTVIGVTKYHTIQHVKAAQIAGIKNLGESKVQEAEKKYNIIKKEKKTRLHLIGHLQSNKTKKAVSFFDVIQTIDSIRLAEKINKEAKKINKKQQVFLQINISNDPKKYGFSEREAILGCLDIQKLSNIQVLGLMTITANSLKEYELRKCYEKMRRLRRKVKSEGLSLCKNLSMGMSRDYLCAIEEGATHVRIGTQLFGERPR